MEGAQRMGFCYKTQRMEADMLDDERTRSTRKILKPIFDGKLEYWLQNHGYGIMVNALTGV